MRLYIISRGSAGLTFAHWVTADTVQEAVDKFRASPEGDWAEVVSVSESVLIDRSEWV